MFGPPILVVCGLNTYCTI